MGDEAARLADELAEARRHQAAITAVLGVINDAAGDLQPVFDAILEKAHSLCGATFGGLMTYDGEFCRLAAASRDVPPAWVDWVRGPFRPGTPASPVSRLIAGAPLLHIEDLRVVAEQHPEEPLPRAGVELGGIRTILYVPLRKDDVLLGFITAYRQEVRPFSERQIALLQGFAAQAVIAMENARLLDALRARTVDLQESLAYQTATSDVLKVISGSRFDLQPVLDTVAHTAQRLCEAHLGGLAVRQGDAYRFVATGAVTPDYDAALRARPFVPGRGSVASRALLERRVVHVVDVEADPEFEFQAAISIGRTRTVLGVPLLREGEVMGVVVLARQAVRPFTERQIELVRIFADQAVIAIENARLLAETRAARDAAETALRDLEAAQASLIQAEKLASLGQLTAGIAHEIKNPLNFVNNFAALSNELLVDLEAALAPARGGLDAEHGADLDETLALLSSNLAKIAEHGRRADNIVKSMLAHSRGAGGARQRVDLNALLDEALNLAYHGARAQDPAFTITLERDLDPALAPVTLVPQDITRVFLNLFGNGFYAAAERRRVAGDGFEPVLRVATRDLGGAAEVRVRDNGTGIPPAIRDKLFEPFFTTKPTGEGTGLGLSISYDIVTKQHGGTITVDSDEGAFTEFTVRLPR